MSASRMTGFAMALLTQDALCVRWEFMRWANTLCAKFASSHFSAICLVLKTTIAQLREQVQNVQ